ncbi:MAG: ABC transporter ATP-binding protein [Thermodesulfobacteriota bacterium]
MPSPLVQLEAVSRIYPQGSQQVRAVDRVDLTVACGEFSALCGPSGSGKTTILNLIGGLDLPSEGRVILEGRDLAACPPGELARLRRDRIGFVFQAYNLIPVLTAFENAEFVLALQGMPALERRQRVMEVLDEVGMAELANRRPDELSGGQQQRVAIARAVAPQPAIVLADEPTANVDSHAAEAILDLMARLNKERGVTFLFATHDPRVMARASRLIHLRDGRLEQEEAKN